MPIGGDTGTGPAVEQAVALVERAAKEAGADRLHTVGIGAPGLIDPATGELRDSGGLPAWHRRLVAGAAGAAPEAARPASRTRPTSRRWPNSATARPGTGTPSSCCGSATAPARPSSSTAPCAGAPPAAPARSASCRCRGRRHCPSATDCEGGFHSLAGSAAIVRLAGGTGWRSQADGHEPPAAARGAGGGGRAVRRSASSTPSPTASPSAPPSVVAVLDPGCVVLGGEVGQAGGADLAGRVRGPARAGCRRCPRRCGPSTLGGGAVLRGALLTARDGAQDELFAARRGRAGRRPGGGQGPSSPPPGRPTGVHAGRP